MAYSGAKKIEHLIFKIMERALFILFDQKNAIVIEEYIVSFFPSLVKEYCLTRQPVVSNELRYVDHYGIKKFEKVVIVGGGSAPFTAMYWANFFKGPIVVLDKSRSAKLFSEKLISKSNITNITILNQRGEDYNGYNNCIVIISLYAENKRGILEKIFENRRGNNMILLRSFFDEQFDSLSNKWEVIEQNSNFHTLVLVIH